MKCGGAITEDFGGLLLGETNLPEQWSHGKSFAIGFSKRVDLGDHGTRGDMDRPERLPGEESRLANTLLRSRAVKVCADETEHSSQGATVIDVGSIIAMIYPRCSPG